ncbi:MAG: glycerophosphodiester phosphodiesterase [Actinomyces sp.]|nr:MAG: glycerophosphodiester phosphodiesterase [Actinomyces sp.]
MTDTSPPARLRLISHAGATGAGDPPGTLSAYRRALAHGFRWIQVDLVPVAGGELLSMHAVTGRRRRLERLDREELRRRAPDHPTLTELLEALPDALVNLEIKSRRAEPALVAVLDRLVAAGRGDRVLVSAPFHRGLLRRIRRRYAGRIATCASLLEGALIGVPLVPCGTPAPRVVQLWWPVALVPGLVGHLDRRGRKVEVWTVNGGWRLRHLVRRGVEGILTDLDHPPVGADDPGVTPGASARGCGSGPRRG